MSTRLPRRRNSLKSFIQAGSTLEDRPARQREDEEERGPVLALAAPGPAGRHARVVVVGAEPGRLSSCVDLSHRLLDDRAKLVDREARLEEGEVLCEVEVLEVRPKL